MALKSPCLHIYEDLSIHIGPCEIHWGIRLSRRLRDCLDSLPASARTCCSEIVRWAISQGQCYNKDGEIKNRLKTIHWTMLCICFVRQTSFCYEYQNNTDVLVTSKFAQFMLSHDWASEAFTLDGIRNRECTEERMFLEDPFHKSTNLAWRVDVERASQMQERMQMCVDYAAHRIEV